MEVGDPKVINQVEGIDAITLLPLLGRRTKDRDVPLRVWMGCLVSAGATVGASLYDII